MAQVSITIDAPQALVFETLCDPDRYVQWVVGAQEVRAVDEDWPAVGTTFHHSVGAGPLRLKDTSTVLELLAPRLLVLKVRTRPLGAGVVRFSLEGDGDGTRVTMHEEPVEGPALRLWNPLMQTMVVVRNRRSLQQLKDVVENGMSKPGRARRIPNGKSGARREPRTETGGRKPPREARDETAPKQKRRTSA